MSRKTKTDHVTKLIAYTDESGNTGMNLFDPDQPYFWTATLIAAASLEKSGTSSVKELAKLAGKNELHGSELGVGRIEQIGAGVRPLLERFNCRFVFTRVEKQYVAATMFANTLLDSDVNMAVSHHHDHVRLYRLMLSYDIMRLLIRRDRISFWSAYQSGDVGLFALVLEHLQGKVFENVKDPRGRELLLDAINWGLENPDVLLAEVRKGGELESPNIIAFTLLIDGINHLLKNTNSRIELFYHDEQNQFAKSIEDTYKIIKNVAVTTTPHFGVLQFEQVDTCQCPITMASSEALAGLQLIDLVLWLAKRNSEKPLDAGLKECFALLSYINQHSAHRDFTWAKMLSDLNHMTRTIMRTPLTRAQEAEGRKRVQQIEAGRKQRKYTTG